jgi:hypothetical protein
LHVSKNVLQCDQKENKSEQALQIISHVIVEFYENKRSRHRRKQLVLMSKKRQWCAAVNLENNFSIFRFFDVYCNYKQQLLS